MTNATPAVTIVFLLAAMAISSPAVAQAIPGPPMGLSTAVSGNDVSFRWTVTSGFPTGYVIEAGSAPGLADIATAHTGFFQQLVVTAVPPGNYFVRVRATNASGTSGPSNEVIVRVGAACQLPPAPVDLTSAVVGASVSLQWSGTGGSFQLEAGSGPGKSDIVNADIGTASSIQVPAPLGFYFVRVRERNSCGFGPPSDEIVVAVGVPDPPANFRASIIGDQVTFRWDALAPSPAGYALEAGSAPGATDVAVLPVGLAASYTAPGVPPGTYYVRLRAFDSAAGGAPSNELVVTVGAPSPWTETVTFSNLFPTDVPLVSYSELGYRVEAVSGPWITGSAIGFTRQAADPLTSGTIRVTANGNPFLFTSVDQYSSETSIPYVFTGLRNGVTVFTAAGTVPTTFGQYARVPNPFPWTVIDTLMITVSNPATPCCSNPVALDNIGLRAFMPPTVRGEFLTPPEPAPASPTDPIVGRYQLDLAIESDCEALPPDERNRRYTADIEAESIAGYDYVVRLYDAWFYVAFACHEPRFPAAADICNQFRATRDGDSLHFDFMLGPDDNWSGNILFEWIPGDLWLEMGGMASGRVETTTVAAAGTIHVNRWTGGLGGRPGATATGCSAAAQLLFIKQ